MGGPIAAPRRHRWLSIVGPLVTFGMFLGFWEYMHRDGMRRLFDKPEFLVPSPVTVVDQCLFDPLVREQLLTGLGWTALVSGAGLAITIAFGTCLAVLMLRAKWMEQSIYPYLVAAQAIPVLAIVPLIDSVFGSGMLARTFVAFMISFFPVATNTLFGLQSVERGSHDLFTLGGASQSSRLLKLQFPAALPSMITGYRISAGLSVIGAVVGELFLRGGGKPGIGIVMDQFRTKSRFPQVYGSLVVACGLGIAVYLLFTLLGKRAVGHWYDAERAH